MRAAMSSVEFCENPHSADASVKTASPSANMFRWPKRSPSLPAGISSTA